MPRKRQSLEDTSGCLPTAYNYQSTAYYSPAGCPSGYTPACSQPNTINKVTETAYTCCPTFSCLTSKRLDVWPFQSSFGCASNYGGVGSVQVTVSDRYSKTLGIEKYDANGGINAFAVQVRFQSTDFVSTTSSMAPTSTPATTASSRVQTSTPTSTRASNANSAPSYTGLSTGAKAGIGVGVALGIVALVALLWLVYRIGQRRLEATQGHEQEHSGAAPPEVKPPLPPYHNEEAWAHSGMTQAAYPRGSATMAYPEDRHEVSGQTKVVHEM
ncbi:hypothetical protein EK21DRAFT_107501 [Setomelanomma holmii]|uniref:Uncharacterized protein n=1 Tax=Setomelanomma holmii TaxID=210430 RepID=A0A9P4HH27_9PLEO|nr:hypothetical protein EK21DRAFT_107501 [Setomelanomma holmii]